MDRLLWAISTGLLTVLIVYFLPLGITKKGKIVVPLMGLLLALIGLTAINTFSIWLTLLILIVLIFFAAYLLDQRMGAFIFETNDSLQGQEEENASLDFVIMETVSNRELDNSNDNNSRIQPRSQNDSGNRNKKDLKTDSEFPTIEPIEDDITFLLNRSVKMEEEINKKVEEPKHDVDYLSEIEELLFDDSEQLIDNSESKNSKKRFTDDEGEDVIPVITFDEKTLKHDKKAELENELEEIPVLSFPEKGGDQ